MQLVRAMWRVQACIGRRCVAGACVSGGAALNHAARRGAWHVCINVGMTCNASSKQGTRPQQVVCWKGYAACHAAGMGHKAHLMVARQLAGGHSAWHKYQCMWQVCVRVNEGCSRSGAWCAPELAGVCMWIGGQ